ncbi:MAG: isochorismatase family protein [Candidatus Heimdallarchaeota archaeon]|nr:isochorismatase family protein [Candidatus Heimdallarchaeota archaeon]
MSGKTILEEWNSIELPPIPEIINVGVKVENTAFLVLDLQITNCNSERRPRCIESLPKIKSFLEKARSSNILIIHSLTSNAIIDDIRIDVKPLNGESVVKSGVDKFLNTTLDAILRTNKIENVIIVGTSAEGAVLNTATGASQRKYKVIIPVDGLSSTEPFAELYTIWHLANSPGTRRNTVLTIFDLIEIVK